MARCSNSCRSVTASKLAWLRDHEPEVFRRTAKVLLPKDYIRLRMTGELATDVGDASGTGLFDVGARAWSAEIADSIVQLKHIRFDNPMFSLTTTFNREVGLIVQDRATVSGMPHLRRLESWVVNVASSWSLGLRWRRRMRSASGPPAAGVSGIAAGKAVQSVAGVLPDE